MFFFFFHSLSTRYMQNVCMKKEKCSMSLKVNQNVHVTTIRWAMHGTSRAFNELFCLTEKWNVSLRSRLVFLLSFFICILSPQLGLYYSIGARLRCSVYVDSWTTTERYSWMSSHFHSFCMRHRSYVIAPAAWACSGNCDSAHVHEHPFRFKRQLPRRRPL